MGTEDFQGAFSRIEAEVDKGNTDLAALGFWRLVRQIKLEARLAEHWADVVGRIDRKAFETAVRFRLPVWLGNAILLVTAGILIFLLMVAIGLGRDAVDGEEQLLPGLIAVAAAGGLSVQLHDLAHWFVGRLVGIRFTSYFLKKPLLTPGLKIDYASYLRVSPGARAVMHASGAIASKIAPLRGFRRRLPASPSGRIRPVPVLVALADHRDRDRADHHRHPVLDQEERLEEGAPRAPGGQSPRIHTSAVDS